MGADISAIVVAVIALAGAALGYVARPLGDYLIERGRDSRRREDEAAATRRADLVALQVAMQETMVHCHEAADANIVPNVEAAVLSAKRQLTRVIAVRTMTDDAELRTLVGTFVEKVQIWGGSPSKRLGSLDDVETAYELASDRLGDVIQKK